MQHLLKQLHLLGSQTGRSHVTGMSKRDDSSKMVPRPRETSHPGEACSSASPAGSWQILQLVISTVLYYCYRCRHCSDPEEKCISDFADSWLLVQPHLFSIFVGKAPVKAEGQEKREESWLIQPQAVPCCCSDTHTRRLEGLLLDGGQPRSQFGLHPSTPRVCVSSVSSTKYNATLPSMTHCSLLLGKKIIQAKSQPIWEWFWAMYKAGLWQWGQTAHRVNQRLMLLVTLIVKSQVLASYSEPEWTWKL